jgi:hypothetical protein
MTPAEESLAAKKRIMFIKGEDFNFLAYNILIILDALRCHSENRPLKDHNKLAYLIDLISSPTLATIIERRERLGSKLSARDLHSLSTAYTNGAARKHFVARVLNSLKTKGLLGFRTGEHDLDLDVWLNADRLPSGFLSSDLYAPERTNIDLLKLVSKFLRTITFSTFISRFYGEQGVRLWHS